MSTAAPPPAGAPISAETADLVLREDAQGIARLTLNRPAARNALSMEMMAALQARLDAIADDARSNASSWPPSGRVLRRP